MKIHPPRLAQRLLRSFLRWDLAEEVQGDLEEQFLTTARKKSVFRAKINYWYQVFHYLRPFAIRKAKSIHVNQYDMFQSYVKIGVRNLLKSKFFSFINISGMAISMAIFFIIALYIHDEWKFDKHIADADLKFRVYGDHFSDDGSRKKIAMVPPPIGPRMAEEYPQVDYYARFFNFYNAPLFEVGEKKSTENKGGAADPSIFKMFSIKLLEGNPDIALSEPNSVAINATLKAKYFGNRSAVGETIEIFDESFTVVAVFEDVPSHSHFRPNFLVSMAGVVPEERMDNWGWSQFHTYVKLKPGADAARLEASLREFVEKNAWPETKQGGGYYIPHLMPVEKIHLHAYDQLWDISPGGNAQTLYILTAIAAFILTIAILNFVNLSTARAINRVKEVGVRKVMGAFRSQLIYQFISESVIIAFMALIIAVFVTELTLPYLNLLAEKDIPLNIILDPLVMLAIICFGVFIGLCAGLYPAFYISANKPAQIISGKNSAKSGRSVFRQSLVVFQFIISFFLIIASFVVSEQHSFMRNADMGFEKENLIVLPLRGDMENNPETTKQSFMNHPTIEEATLGYGLPGEAFAGDGFTDKQTGKDWHVNMLTVDHDYVKTLGLEIIAGRDFSEEIPSDVYAAFILSEAAAKMLGYADPAEALGHEIAWDRWDAPDSVKEGTVIGIVKDIQLNSMRENIAPVAIQIFPFAYSTLTLRVKPDNLPATIEHLEKTWKTYNTEWPFEFRFLDDNFDKMYKAEEKLSVLFRIFTGFTIFVACLGLFGLVVYSTTQRYREVSIRKVLGASEKSLLILLAKNYMVLIAIAFVIAIPLSYYATWQWLQNFVFRIQITPLLFVKAGLLILVISLVTIGVQSLRATRANPVDALKEQ